MEKRNDTTRYVSCVIPLYAYDVFQSVLSVSDASSLACANALLAAAPNLLAAVVLTHPHELLTASSTAPSTSLHLVHLYHLS